MAPSHYQWLGAIVQTWTNTNSWAGSLVCVCRMFTHWGRVTHICVKKLAIIWSNDGILLIGPLGTNFSEIFIGIHTFSFNKIHLKMSSGKSRPFCLGLNVLRVKWPDGLPTAALGATSRSCRSLASSCLPCRYRLYSSQISGPRTLASAHRPPTQPEKRAILYQTP